MKSFLLSLGFLSLIIAPSSQAIEPAQDFVNLAKKVRSSVVNISVSQPGINKVIELIPGYMIPFSQPELKGSGSGFIVDKSGLIITNAHVVKDIQKIQVQFVDEETLFPAKVLGYDTRSDIALLKVDAKKKLTPIVLGDSSKLEVGEWVAAIGNPHGYGHTMTKGIISAVKREIDELNLYPLLQTDASINPGNSGGPLVNLKGEVVGVNQAIARNASGISFAIPINNVKEVLEDLKKYGYVRKAFIGVNFLQNNLGLEGVIVGNVVVQSPAQRAGVRAGDRIVSFNGKKIKNYWDLPDAVRKAKVGKKASMTVIRENKTLKLSITPQIFEGEKLALSSNKINPKATDIYGHFEVLPARDSLLKKYGHPGWAKHPIIVNVKKSSRAYKNGLREGDLLFQINNSKVLKAGDVQKTFQKGKTYQIHVLRYYRNHSRYRILSLNLKL